MANSPLRIDAQGATRLLEHPFPSKALRDLKAQVVGELLCPHDHGYDEARKVWNGMVDKSPAVIVRCANQVDVSSAIQCAREHHLLVAIRGGGHSLCGHSVCGGGMLIDLSRMKGIRVNPEQKVAWAQAGLTLGEFVQATQTYGLATTTGNVAGTGLAGLTLGGGLGWFVGKHGLTIDNLLAVNLITGDGQVLKVSASEHPDLFWGVRGGGGNFGIATSFAFQLHPVGVLLAGKVVYPMSRAREVLHFYREYTSTAPDELTANASLLTTPDGLPAIAINLCYCGPLKAGERLIKPVRTFGVPLADLIRPKSYLKMIAQADLGAPAGRCYYEKASTLTELSDEAIETIAAYGSASTSPLSHVLIQHMHGAASRIDPTATAFALRGESYVICIVAAWNSSQSGHQHTVWAHAFSKALKPFASSGTYVNFLGDEGEERVRAAYGVNYERLVALKNRYDPYNFFALNQNIKPTI